jgi:hypothetical protein
MKILPRVFLRACVRVHLLKSRLTVKMLTFASAASSSLVTVISTPVEPPRLFLCLIRNPKFHIALPGPHAVLIDASTLLHVQFKISDFGFEMGFCPISQFPLLSDYTEPICLPN